MQKTEYKHLKPMDILAGFVILIIGIGAGYFAQSWLDRDGWSLGGILIFGLVFGSVCYTLEKLRRHYFS